MIVTASPHILGTASTRGVMLNVAFALLPTLVAAGLIFGARAWLLTGVTVASCIGFEALYNILRGQPQTVGDMSALVTGVILACNLPSTLPLWIAMIGAFVAIVVTKMLFGGLGCNFANPALVGRMVLFIGFAGRMTSYGFPAVSKIDALASATPLVAGNSATGMSMLLQLLLGTHGGVLGETCALTLILGGVYLIATKTISASIPLSYLGTVAVLSAVLGQDIVLQLFSGGLLLAAFFMATDYVTSPFTRGGKIVFGVGLGVLTCLIRFYGTMAEGVSFSLLIMNLLVPYINNLTRQKPLGGVKAK
ncbi:MAG: RnfABCDGE type electron transport complex subunit D [Ruthenibacterium sp.]